jgi:excisionase family DNA binding protein
MTSVEYGREVAGPIQAGGRSRGRPGDGLDDRRNGAARSTPGPPRPVPLIAFTRREAAESIGVGLTTFKEQIQPHLRVVRRGKVRLIPVAELERWLEENAEPGIGERD